MLYIISEDQGAGLQFWRAIKTEILECSPNVKVMTSKGVRNIPKVLLNLGIKSGDTILLAIDMVIDNISAPIAEIIDAAINLANERNVRLICTTYYCFEEIFLTYKYLVELASPKINNELARIVQETQEAIKSGINYAKYPGEVTSRLLDSFDDMGRPIGRERLAKQILALVTSKITGVFRITSGNLGACWIEDCKQIREKGIAYSEMCTKCKSKCIGLSGKQKILHLENSTLFSYSSRILISSLTEYIN